MEQTMELTTVTLPGQGDGLAAGDDDCTSKSAVQRIRAMFAEVITHALREATYSAVASPVGPRKLKKMKYGPSAKLRFIQKQALVWLTGSDPGFDEVCEIAGFHPGQTRKRIRRILDDYLPAIRDYEALPSRDQAGAA